MKFKFLIVILAFVLSACVSAIQHKVVSDTTHWLRINGTTNDDMQSVEVKWRNQASKICGPNGYTTSDLETDTEMSGSVDFVALMAGVVIGEDKHNPYAVGHAECKTSSNKAIKKDV